MSLGDRLEELGRRLGDRESSHVEAIEEARAIAEKLRQKVAPALDRYHEAIDASGAPHLRVILGEIRTDDKHARSVQFDVSRGRSAAIVTVKSRGDVTLVGPFHRGKNEGPCRTFPFDAEADLEEALGDVLTGLLEEAARP